MSVLSTSAVSHSGLSVAERASRTILRVILYALLVLLAVGFAFPFYAMIVGSFMEQADLFSLSPSIVPRHVVFTNFSALFAEMPFHAYVFNSVKLAVGQTLGVLFFCSLAGFTFAKRRFPGRDALFTVLLTTMMIPGQSTLIPFYLLMARLGWLNTFLPLWIPWWAPAFGIFLMRQYMVSLVPDELIDAATMDGCSLFGVFWRVALPVAVPGLIVLGILNFINAWNDFLYSLLVFTGELSRTAPLALALFLGSQTNSPRYTEMFAGGIIATFPLIVIFFVFQRRLVEGVMAGAIKG
jgi:ABC-type glycerol-3-phosphate transport system permease component